MRIVQDAASMDSAVRNMVLRSRPLLSLANGPLSKQIVVQEALPGHDFGINFSAREGARVEEATVCPLIEVRRVAR